MNQFQYICEESKWPVDEEGVCPFCDSNKPCLTNKVLVVPVTDPGGVERAIRILSAYTEVRHG